MSNPRPPDTEEPSFDLYDLASPTDGRQGPSLRSFDDPIGALDIRGARAQPSPDALAWMLGDSPALASTPKSARLDASTSLACESTDSVLNVLNDEFVRVVRDPTQLAGRGGWERVQASEGQDAPSLADLGEQARTFALVRDIVLPRQQIDRLIDGFETLGHSNLLDAQRPGEVLWMFAPELVRAISSAVPSLTRRDHHALSPDSHVSMGPALPPEETSE